MATLTLSGFRCYEQEQTFSFNTGQIIRLCGKSGIGKSTIFEAIQWVLYNYPTTNIYPRNGGIKKTSVTLRVETGPISPLTIIRQKNPSLLRLIYPDGSFEEDDVAQGTINNLYGIRDIWRVCCYLPQGENCPLLGFSNLQRMEILEDLAFLNGRPEEDLHLIIEEVKRLEAEFSLAEGLYLQAEKKLGETIFPGDEELLDEETLVMVEAKIKELNTKLKDIDEEIIITNERKKQKKKLMTDLDILESMLKTKYQEISPDDIKNHQSIIRSLQEELSFSQNEEMRLRLIKKQETLHKNLSSLHPSNRLYTSEEYQETLVAENRWQEEFKIASNHHIDYTSTAVNKEISRIQGLIEGHKKAEVWLRINNLRQQLDSLEGLEVTDSDLARAREEIQGLERSIDVLKCPACQRSLRYLRKSLVLSETSPIAANKIKNMREGFQAMEAEYKKGNQRKTLVTQLESLLSTVNGKEEPHKPLIAGEIKKHETRLVQLQRLTFPSKPEISSREIKEALDYHKYNQELVDVEVELNNYPPPDKPIRTKKELLALIDDHNDKIIYLRDVISSRQKYLHQKENLIIDINTFGNLDIDTLKNKRDAYTEQLKLIEAALANHQETILYLQKEEQATQLFNQSNLLNQELAAAIRLRDVAHQEECNILEEKITIINLAIAELCSKIFSDPITVELAITKTTKTTHITKPCVHLKIWYKGGEYDSLSQLSGGEGKRISIAVALALSKLNNFPLLLFDEVLAGLDDENKEITLEAVREICGGKTLISILHSGITGIYDTIIDLD